MPSLAWTQSRRRRFLKDRPRPLPLGILVINCMSVSTGPTHAANILRHGSLTPGVDVLLGSECADFRGRVVLDGTWDVYQPGGLGSPQSGCLIAVRRSRGDLTNCVSELAATAGAGIRDRYVIAADITVDRHTRQANRYHAKAGHAPPMRSWVKWPGYMTHMRHADFAGADFNKLSRAVGPALGRRMRMVHILGLAVRWWIPSSKPRAVDVGGDHDAVLVTLWPETSR